MTTKAKVSMATLYQGEIARLQARIAALEEALRLFAQDDGLAVLDEEAYRQARALLDDKEATP